MKLRIGLFASALITVTVHGGIVHYVDVANCPGPGDGTEANPFCLIQDAINTAAEGDEIVVAPGLYPELINIDGDRLLRSSDGAEVTIIDAQGQGTVVDADDGPVIDGFTITGGNANGGGFNNHGGGIYNSSSSPTVTNCTISGNSASGFGGGMFLL